MLFSTQPSFEFEFNACVLLFGNKGVSFDCIKDEIKVVDIVVVVVVVVVVDIALLTTLAIGGDLLVHFLFLELLLCCVLFVVWLVGCC